MLILVIAMAAAYYVPALTCARSLEGSVQDRLVVSGSYSPGLCRSCWTVCFLFINDFKADSAFDGVKKIHAVRRLMMLFI